MRHGVLGVLGVMVVVGLAGCSGKLVTATRTQAAADFKCDAAAIEVRGDEVYGKFHAAGCGQEGTYSAQCVAGKCEAERLRGG